MPWIRHIFPSISSYKQLRNASMELFDFMKDLVMEQVNTYQEGHIRSFMDIYIKEIKDAELQGEESGFKCNYIYEIKKLITAVIVLVYFSSDDQMIMICTDFLFPSLSAIEIQVSFLFKHLVYRTDIVDAIQKEIDNVVGSGRLPELDDRIKYVFYIFLNLNATIFTF